MWGGREKREPDFSSIRWSAGSPSEFVDALLGFPVPPRYRIYLHCREMKEM